MKKSVRCPPDYLQFTSTAASSSSGSMTSAGNPPDRGPSVPPLKSGMTKKPGILTTASGGLNLPRTMSTAQSTSSLLNCGSPSSTFLSPSFIQNAVQQVLPPTSRLISASDTGGNDSFSPFRTTPSPGTSFSTPNATYYEYIVPSSQIRSTSVGKNTPSGVNKTLGTLMTKNRSSTATIPSRTPTASILNRSPIVTSRSPTVTLSNRTSTSGSSRNSTVTVSNRSPTVSSRSPAVTVANRNPTVTVSNRSPTVTVSNRNPTVTVSNRNPTVTVSNRNPTVTVSNRNPTVTVSNRSPTVTVANKSPSIVPRLSPTVTILNKSQSSRTTVTSSRWTPTSTTSSSNRSQTAPINVAHSSSTIPSTTISTIPSRTLTATGTIKPPTTASQQSTATVSSVMNAAAIVRCRAPTETSLTRRLPSTVTSGDITAKVMRNDLTAPYRFVRTYAMPTSQNQLLTTTSNKGNISEKSQNLDAEVIRPAPKPAKKSSILPEPVIEKVVPSSVKDPVPCSSSEIPVSKKSNSKPTTKHLRKTKKNPNSIHSKCSRSTRWEFQSSKCSALSDTEHYIAESGTLKRKINEQQNHDLSKRRKIKLSTSVTRKNVNIAVSKQWSNLLSCMIQKVKSSKLNNKLHVASTSSATPTITSILPIKNSLLIKYDPIKILSRPALVATLKNNKPHLSKSNKVPSSVTLQVPNTSALKLLPTPGKGQDSLKSSQIGPKSTAKCQTSKTTVRFASSNVIPSQVQKKVENLIMPPPKFPPMWSSKKKTAGSGTLKSVKIQVSDGASKSIEIEQPINKPHHQSNQIKQTNLQYLEPKVNFAASIFKNQNEVKYQPPTSIVTEKDLRLATIAFSRKILKRSKKKRLMSLRSMKNSSSASVDLKSTSSSFKPVTVKKSDVLYKKCSDPTKANIQVEDCSQKKSKLANKDTTKEVPSNSGVKNVDRPKKEVFWRKKPDTIGKIPENPLVEHTVDLLRHKRELQRRIELIDNEGVVYRLEKLPRLKQPIIKGQLDFENIPLTAYQSKTIIQKRLAILLALGGYTHTNVQPLEILADVMESFYMKMAHRLKQVTEMEMAGCEQEFPDPLERALVEMGLGGVRGIETFYKTGVVSYRKRLEDQCIQLRQLYANKIRLKVGMVVSESGGNSSTSTSSSTTTSSQPMSPGNSVITEILSGLEDPMAFSSPCESRQSFAKNVRPLQPTSSHQLQVPSLTGSKGSSQISSNLLNRPLNPNAPPLMKSPSIPQVIRSSSVAATAVSQSHTSSNQVTSRSDQPKSVTIVQSGGASSSSSFSSNMVSINLNNNVDLGGFVPITSPEVSRTPTLNVTTGIMRNSIPNSKAKLKEALSQRNLLRLNFEQVPSSCDSTIILSSSSPSLSSSGSTVKSSNPSSSISQTSKLKL